MLTAKEATELADSSTGGSVDELLRKIRNAASLGMYFLVVPEVSSAQEKALVRLGYSVTAKLDLGTYGVLAGRTLEAGRTIHWG